MTTEPLEMVAESVLTSVARLRRFAVAACREHSPAVDCETVALLVSEVSTNALVHGAGQVRLRVLPMPGALRVEVLDASPALPCKREASLLDEGGRGMALVEALASAWGADTSADGGKTVWFEVLDR